MIEYLRNRIKELNELEERLLADINQVVGMRAAFKEVLDMYDDMIDESGIDDMIDESGIDDMIDESGIDEPVVESSEE